MVVKYVVISLSIVALRLLIAGDTLLWHEEYSGSGSLNDRTSDVSIDDSLNVYVTGQTSKTNGHDITTIKYDNNGSVEWKTTTNVRTHDDTYAICLDDSGNAYVVGRACDDTSHKLVIIRYNSNDGFIQWKKTNLDALYSGEDYSIAADKEGNVYVATQVHDPSIPLIDAWLLKFDGDDGRLLWADTLDLGEGEVWKDIAIDDSNYVYVGGVVEAGGESGEWFCVAKYQPNGLAVWVSQYGTTTSTGCDAIDIDDDGCVCITGTKGYGPQRMTIFKVDSDGDSAWQYTYIDGTRVSAGKDIATCCSTGTSYVTGIKYYSGVENILTVAVDVDGDLLWTRDYGNASKKDCAYELDIMRNCVYVIGYTQPSSDYDILTLCYWRSCGALMWCDTLDYNSSNEESNFIAVKRKGIWTYIAEAGYTASDWTTLMYAYNEDQTPIIDGIQCTKTGSIKPPLIIQSQPNPCSNGLTIRFEVSHRCNIDIELYDVAGCKIVDIYHGYAKAGMNEISYRCENLHNGVYLLRFVATTEGETTCYDYTDKIVYLR